MDATVICPVCNSQQPGNNNECTSCGSDLSLLAAFDGLALRYYSEALTLAKDEGRSGEAVEKLRAAIALDPGRPEFHVVLAKLRAQQEDYEEAIAEFRRALDLAPAGSPVQEKARRGLEKAGRIEREREETVRTRERETLARGRRRRYYVAAAAGGVLAAGVALGMIAAPRPMPGKPSPAVPAAQMEAIVQRVIAGMPPALSPNVSRWVGEDFVKALSVSRVKVSASPGGGYELEGSVPLPEVKQFLQTVAVAVVGDAQVQVGALAVADDYTTYTVREGDCPERIARRLCGSPRHVAAIAAFSEENARALARMQIGSVLKIPKRLLVKPRSE
jgi:hypothetical protein